MGRKTIVGVIATVVIVATVILCGCIDEITQPTPSPATTPSSSSEIEYPVTAYFEVQHLEKLPIQEISMENGR